MKVFINYDDIKIPLNIKPYQSVNSIINEYLKENILISEEEKDNFFLDYNGILLNKNLSLEKYNILNNSLLNIRKKVKGGNSFFSFASKNIVLVVICFIIALLPIFILPMGFIPLTSSLIKIIIEKSIDSIGKYLVCTLGKITLFKRFKLIIYFIKYIIFILMIFVIITFPLILLCITLKGQTITSNPKNVCGAINAGNIAGFLLTVIFIFVYIFFKGGDYVIDFIINLFKKVYILNTIFNPLLSTLRTTYDKFKYVPLYAIPILGQGLLLYYQFLEGVLPLVTVVLESITSVGCNTDFLKDDLTNIVINKMNELNNKKEQNIHDENKKIKLFSFSEVDDLCIESKNNCCNPKNYLMIGNIFLKSLNNSIVTSTLKSYNMYPAFILVTQSFFESSLEMSNNYENFSSNNYEQKRLYLRKILEEKINKIPEDLEELINNYLESSNNSLVPEIQEKLDKIFFKKNINLTTEVNQKVALLEEIMISFSKENNSAYVPGGSLFKKIFKIVFLDTLCNIFATAKSSQSVISKMGEMNEIIDMLKSGTASGIITSSCYLITVIILIICGIFNIF